MTMTSPIIFLDIDGVLKPFEFEDEGFASSAVEALNWLIKESQADLVISSTWRLQYSLPDLNECLLEEGVMKRAIDVTPDLSRRHPPQKRGAEIGLWLERHPEVKRFVIIDDWDEMEALRPHLVLTNPSFGLTLEKASAALAKL
jgi:hypothetical protein